MIYHISPSSLQLDPEPKTLTNKTSNPPPWLTTKGRERFCSLQLAHFSVPSTFSLKLPEASTGPDDPFGAVRMTGRPEATTMSAYLVVIGHRPGGTSPLPETPGRVDQLSVTTKP
jgi:hypothetical protein